jgi:3-isopropylmalate dehydrogenase
MGQNKANPSACILSFAMALRYSFDQGDAADMLEGAVEAVLAGGTRTADLMQSDGGKAVGTSEMGNAILAKLSERNA